MKKGLEPAYPIVSRGSVGHFGVSVRLKIASDAMCGLLANANEIFEIEDVGITTMKTIVTRSIQMADLLIKLEEETRNDT